MDSKDKIAAKNSGDMSIEIMRAIVESPPENFKHVPDALIRIFVSLAKDNGWSLEMIEEQTLKGVRYYFESDKLA